MKNKMDFKSFVYLILFIVISLATGFLGSLATASSVDTWYVTLNKPAFTPPGWIFAPVWTLLYIFMGIAAFLVWKSEGLKSRKNLALGIFFFQLILNFLWSVFFFGLQAPALALADIFFLWLAIIIMMGYFFKLSRAAGYLLVPYILWVSFASVLNVAIVVLNS